MTQPHAMQSREMEKKALSNREAPYTGIAVTVSAVENGFVLRVSTPSGSFVDLVGRDRAEMLTLLGQIEWRTPRGDGIE